MGGGGKETPLRASERGFLPPEKIPLIFQTVDRGRDAAAEANEVGGVALGHGDNGGLTEETAEGDFLAHALAGYGDNAHGGGLVVDHADPCRVRG